MRLLITGGFGYLGGRLAQYFCENEEYTVLLGTRKKRKSPRWLPYSKTVQTKWDSLSELEEICEGVDAIVHLAGMNANDCVANPIAALEFNAVVTARLLQAAINKGVKRIVYFSTAHVYCSPLVGNITERTCPTSLHPYATSHRAAEDVIRNAHENGYIDGTVVRLSNAIGAPTHNEVNCWDLLVNDLCKQAVNSNLLALHSSGRQKRNFIAISEVCRAVKLLLEVSSNKLGDGVFNVGSGLNISVYEMAQKVSERFKVVTGEQIEIFCKSNNELFIETEVFEYSIKKLLNIGFANSDNKMIDQELDNLIRFCLN